MKIILSNNIAILSPPLDIKTTIIKKLTIHNPKWLENNRLGRWNQGVPEYLKFYQEHKKKLSMPRGFMRPLINICHYHGIKFEIKDKRRKLSNVDFSFSGKLKPFQQIACDEMLKKQFGVLTAPTGSGKTVMLLYMLSMRNQPALIVVHTKDLAFQWIDRIQEFLNIPKDEIGFIGAGKFSLGEKITVAMVQSLYKKTKETIPFIGYVVVDECHRVPSRTFYEAVGPFDSFYMTGLSATPWRRDDLSDLIFWHLGDLVYEVNKSDLIEHGDILKPEIIFRETEFQSELDASQHYANVMKELINDKKRNTLIASDIANEANKQKGIILVLSDRKQHCETINTFLKYHYKINCDLLTGDLTTKQRKHVLEKLKNSEIKVLIATGQLLGEGFDLKELATLFLIFPIKFSGRLLQYLGRVLRPAPGKTKARVFDYIDIKVGVLEAAAKSRQAVYQNLEN